LDSAEFLSSTLTPSPSFLLPSIFNNDTISDIQPTTSFQIPPPGPYSVGKRHHDQTLDSNFSDSAKSQKGKKVKVDGSTKRERNKVSAAKYRQRRKVYIDGLEDQLRQLNEKLEAQSKMITALKTENQMLKEHTNYLKKLVESLSIAKNSVQSMSPLNFIKGENSIGKAVKPMGAGLFLLAICCLVISFQPFNDSGSMSTLPVRHTSRTLLHHQDSYDSNDASSTTTFTISSSSSLSDNAPGSTLRETEITIDSTYPQESDLARIEVLASHHSYGNGRGNEAAA